MKAKRNMPIACHDRVNKDRLDGMKKSGGLGVRGERGGEPRFT